MPCSGSWRAMGQREGGGGGGDGHLKSQKSKPASLGDRSGIMQVEDYAMRSKKFCNMHIPSFPRFSEWWLGVNKMPVRGWIGHRDPTHCPLSPGIPSHCRPMSPTYFRTLSAILKSFSASARQFVSAMPSQMSANASLVGRSWHLLPHVKS